ncbi:MAG: dTMP kinase [Anaerolineaceae bacterium]|nr:dTMP kinase [Anaerolineaceae bacterium]
MFITFEGPDGSGKTTQLNGLMPVLEKQGLDVIRTREPGGTEIGDQIRSVIMDMKNKSMTPRAEILLFCASRAQLVEELIRPSLAAGKIILCDRYADSTMAYQGYGHGLDREALGQLLHFATGGLKPDLTLLFDIPSEAGLRRRLSNHEEWNRMDDYALQFHERVRNGYLEMAAAEPDRYVIINADRSKEEIHKEVVLTVMRKLNRS